MPGFARLLSFRHRTACLLAAGLFAVAMHALGGTGLMHRSSIGGGFEAEICTARGLARLDPARQSGAPTDSGHQDCCKLCGVSASLLFADAVLGVPPAPTVAGVFSADPAPRPAAIVRVSHPPRGPPSA
jgi:hypothetical protein